MIKKLKEFIAKKKNEQRQKKYQELLQAGGLFLQYVFKDIQDTSRHDRGERRRFEHQLEGKAKFSSEMCDYYFKKLEEILIYIHKYELLKKEAYKKATKLSKNPTNSNIKKEEKTVNA